jgi:hypothetical protein
MGYTHSPTLLLFIQTSTTLRISDRGNETLEITVELEIISQAPDFFNQILSFLAYGGSSVMKILDKYSLHMRRMELKLGIVTCWMVRVTNNYE